MAPNHSRPIPRNANEEMQQPRSTATTSNNANTGSILDVIHEKTANVEQINNQQNTLRLLHEAIKLLGKRERALRESTITVCREGGRLGDKRLEHNEIVEIIEKIWCQDNDQITCTYWQDKTNTYCQFIDCPSKNAFLDKLSSQATEINQNQSPNIELLRVAIIKPNNAGLHYTRKPARLEISNVRHNIKLDTVKDTLERLTSAIGQITDLKEGKEHKVTKIKSIYFRTNSAGFAQLMGPLDGAIPYTNKSTQTRTRLFIKLNCRPWQCKECAAYGQHQCIGKCCAQCGNKGHEARDCYSRTKTCNNCKKRGHRAKDSHCPMYISETIKELRKMDIPLEYLEDKELRTTLIRALQYK